MTACDRDPGERQRQYVLGHLALQEAARIGAAGGDHAEVSERYAACLFFHGINP
jgi:hypothetical protein